MGTLVEVDASVNALRNYRHVSSAYMENAASGVQAPPAQATPASAINEADLAKLNSILDGEDPNAAVKTPAPPPTAPTPTPAPAPAPAPATTPDPAAPTTPAPEPTSDQLKALDSVIEDATKASPAVTPEAPPPLPPPATPEIAQLQAWSQNPEYAKEAVTSTLAMIELNKAASAGDVQGVLSKFHPAFVDALMENIYQTQKENFAKRFVDEHDGKATKPDPRINQLEAQLEELRSGVNEENNRRKALEQDWSSRQQKQAYRNNWDTMFRAVNITDKKTQNRLMGETIATLSDAAENGDKAAQQTIAQMSKGNYRGLNLKFRDVYVDYIKDTKSAETATAQVRQKQESNKVGQLASNSGAGATVQSTPAQNDDFDSDGRRNESFWARNMKKLGLLDD